jgi:hypothetical protein
MYCEIRMIMPRIYGEFVNVREEMCCRVGLSWTETVTLRCR